KGTPILISPAFAITSRCSLSPLIVSPPGSEPEHSLLIRESVSSFIQSESRTLPTPPQRKFTELLLGHLSSCLGPQERMFRNCKFAWSVLPVRKPTTRFKERPGWMTSPWFRSLRSIANHEVAAFWHLRAGRVCRCCARRCGGLGASRLRNRRRIAVSRLGCVDLCHA